MRRRRCWEAAHRQHALNQALRAGCLSARTYAWLWHSLGRYGPNWRWN